MPLSKDSNRVQADMPKSSGESTKSSEVGGWATVINRETGAHSLIPCKTVVPFMDENGEWDEVTSVPLAHPYSGPCKYWDVREADTTITHYQNGMMVINFTFTPEAFNKFDCSCKPVAIDTWRNGDGFKSDRVEPKVRNHVCGFEKLTYEIEAVIDLQSRYTEKSFQRVLMNKYPNTVQMGAPVKGFRNIDETANPQWPMLVDLHISETMTFHSDASYSQTQSSDLIRLSLPADEQQDKFILDYDFVMQAFAEQYAIDIETGDDRDAQRVRQIGNWFYTMFTPLGMAATERTDRRSMSYPRKEKKAKPPKSWKVTYRNSPKALLSNGTTLVVT